MGFSHTDLDNLLAAALRGEAPPCPPGPVETWLPELLDRANLHGVHALLHRQSLPWPHEAVQAIRERALAQAAWELRHEQAVQGALQALSRAGLRPLIIKGTALAYSLYDSPVLRARGDTDLLVGAGEARVAGEALSADGWTRLPSGDEAAYQATYLRHWPDGTHAIDLHWKINNSEVLSRLFTHDELLAVSEPVPALGPHALAPNPVDALLIACLHRATHRTQPYLVDGAAHHEPDRLIWLMDIHLLAGRLSQAEWSRWTAAALDKGLAGCCLEALESAVAALGTQPPGQVLSTLAAAPKGHASEYLHSESLRQHWLDMQASGSASGRLRWLSHRLFPPADYMRRKYASAQVRWLPWLYLRRAATGLARRAIPR